MAKTIVYKAPDGDQTPFLRGILTRSLANAGLSFDNSYLLAQRIRNELKDTEEVSTKDLKAMVSELIEKEYGKEQAERYLQKLTKSDIVVHTSTHSDAFSLSILARSLSSIAINHESALFVAKKVYSILKNEGYKEIQHQSLRRITYECLVKYSSNEVADRYLSWRGFENSGTPLILLIGGIAGSGKSTLTTELAYILNIVRTQSTDMLREIVRTYLATPVSPTLQYSTFEAWRGLPTLKAGNDTDLENPVVTGFLSQLVTLKPAIEAAISRSAREQEHLIIEGVHALCTELNLEEIRDKAIIVPVMIATLDKKALRNRYVRRGKEKNMRQPARYVDNIDAIWELQSYLLDLSDQAGVHIINNTTLKDSISEILELISTSITGRFPPNPSSLDDIH